jgi:hypothetical protein
MNKTRETAHGLEKGENKEVRKTATKTEQTIAI